MNIDELTVRWQENGKDTVDELGKVVLTTSPMWATVAYLLRERDPNTEEWRAPRVQLRRYKKRGGKWTVDKHFTLTTAAQALALAGTLTSWFAEGGPGQRGGVPVVDDD